MKQSTKNCMNHVAVVSVLLGMSGCAADSGGADSFGEEHQEAGDALTSTVFEESFENVNVAGDSSTAPTGWVKVGHPSYVGLVDVASGFFTTPYGSQGMKTYSTTSSWAHAVTTSSILNETLAANRQYTLTFNVAAFVGRPTAHFRAELVAVNASTNTTTVLASQSGNNDGTTNMSYSASIIFTPNASHASLVGQRLAIRLGMNPNYPSSPNANWRNLPMFDNVVLKATTVNEQYTPDQSDWSTFATKPFPTNYAHDPDGVSWITPAQWQAAEWDGTTIYDPTKMTQAQFAAAICPSGDTIRGLREVFYQHNPFSDVNNPTKAEVDEWHRIAINHIRALVGYTSADRQVQKDHCLFAQALWSSQRAFTTMWDAEYPGTVGSAYGPCQGSANAHCGATFVPDAEDQAPYLPAGHPTCGATGAEGIFNASKSDIPWSIKFSRSFCSTLKNEGFWGGHTGPWYHREKFGFDFWDSSPGLKNSNAILRANWGGNLMPSLY